MGIRLPISYGMDSMVQFPAVVVIIVMVIVIMVVTMNMFVTIGIMGVARARGDNRSGVQKLGGLHMVGEYCLSQGFCLRFTQFLLGLVDHLVKG
jgi:hypothetical protein